MKSPVIGGAAPMDRHPGARVRIRLACRRPSGVVCRRELAAFHVGQRIALNTPVESITFPATVTILTFGGAIDLVKAR